MEIQTLECTQAHLYTTKVDMMLIHKPSKQTLTSILSCSKYTLKQVYFTLNMYFKLFSQVYPALMSLSLKLIKKHILFLKERKINLGNAAKHSPRKPL